MAGEPWPGQPFFSGLSGRVFLARPDEIKGILAPGGFSSEFVRKRIFALPDERAVSAKKLHLRAV